MTMVQCGIIVLTGYCGTGGTQCNVLSAQCSQCLFHSTTVNSVGIHMCVVQELTNNYVGFISDRISGGLLLVVG